ncbi:MAG: hypothetical protein HYV26_22560 [Candidatus Hydrogenedentes bacterium]|nr:hypothetical protein [Candidatus Hydrogenedentota bacterium]
MVDGGEIEPMKHALLFTLFLTVIGDAAADPSEAWRARTARAQELDVGESAPDWLIEAETYAIGYSPADWGALAESKVTFLTHCPINPDFFARAHVLGIRCFPYVTFYQGFASITYEGINLKDHPEFIEVNAEGNLVRTGFWESEDSKNMYTTCPNVQEYQDRMVAWVRKLMELGADGVFVDNLGGRAPCSGPQFGKHQHLYDDQTHAFAMLLKRVRETVKEFQPDGAVLGNSASPTTLPKEYWKYLDAEMLESYICTWVSKERWFDWKDHWNKAGRDLQPYVQAGKQIQALSYLGQTPYGVREDAFFCYASARLAGFVWSGGRPLSDPEVADLHRVRLGRALTEELEENGVHYRIFERGLVAVNPERERAAKISMGPPAPGKRLLDLFGSGADGWSPYGTQGYANDTAQRHSGERSIVCESTSQPGDGGAAQTITLQQTEAQPVTISGWSRAENVSGDADGNYALYADVQYTDGDWLYGHVAPFAVGTHDWQEATVTIQPEKPVQSLTLNALFRQKTGKAWFDDLSLREDDDSSALNNGGFEAASRSPRQVELADDLALEIPAYSGRVFLFTPSVEDVSNVKGPRLTVVTDPPLGEVRFRVDGFDYWTHSGRWTTEYVKGGDFGKFHITFEQPGKHTIEIVDVVPADMKTPAGYGTGERLGQFMDPSNPTQPSSGKSFHFREWAGQGPAAQVEVDVKEDTTVTAQFDAERAP